MSRINWASNCTPWPLASPSCTITTSWRIPSLVSTLSGEYPPGAGRLLNQRTSYVLFTPITGNKSTRASLGVVGHNLFGTKKPDTQGAPGVNQRSVLCTGETLFFGDPLLQFCRGLEFGLYSGRGCQGFPLSVPWRGLLRFREMLK